LLLTKTSIDKGVNPIISTQEKGETENYKNMFAKRREFKDIFNQKDEAKQKKPRVSAFVEFDRVYYYLLII